MHHQLATRFGRNAHQISGHGALAYYFRHETEIDNYLRQREGEAEKLRQEIQAANTSRLTALKARLDAVKAKGNGGCAPTTD